MPVTPHHQDARLAHDSRWDLLAKSRENWRVSAAVLLLLCCFLSAAVWRLAFDAQVLTYVVEIDRFGQPRYAGTIEDHPIPEDLLWKWVLSRWIGEIRNVPRDPEQLRLALESALAHLRGQALETAQEYLKRNNPFETAKTVSVTVEAVPTILRRTKNVWQIEWTELHRPLAGPASEVRWQALVTTFEDAASRRGPRNPLNPLRLYITSLDWTPISRRSLQ